VLLGVLLAAGAVLIQVGTRTNRTTASSSAGGAFSVCTKLSGAKARECYKAEVGRELAAVGTPQITFQAPANSGEVTFTASTDGDQPLLCALHTRVGVTSDDVPSWVSWSEPIAESAPPS